VAIENQLIKLTYNKVPAVRQAAVWALGEMKVHRNDAYLTVVRRLVDNDKGTRKEAKKVLKTLTGNFISFMSQGAWGPFLETPDNFPGPKTILGAQYSGITIPFLLILKANFLPL